MRKTVKITDVLVWANRRLADKDLPDDAGREISGLLATILQDADAYAGFQYLHWRDDGGCEAWLATGLADTPENHDRKEPYITGGKEYRREYYKHRGL